MVYTRQFLFLGVAVLCFANRSCHGSIQEEEGKVVVCESSCGHLRNISYPFRLKGDPSHCGKKDYELACVENRAILLFRDDSSILHIPMSYVEAINYNNYTIRIVDVGIQKGNCSSFPLGGSISLIRRYEVDTEVKPWSTYEQVGGRTSVAALLDCENPVTTLLKNSSGGVVRYEQAAPTGTTPDCSGSIFSKRNHFYYFVFGDDVRLEHVEVGCRLVVSVPVLASANDEPKQNHHLSFLDFHDKMAFGYELSWISHLCNCSYSSKCLLDVSRNSVYCIPYETDPCLRVPYNKSFKCRWTRFYYSDNWYYFYGTLIVLKFLLGGIIGVRESCGSLCIFIFIIYKYRRRNMSVFENIEGFLQSNNALMPIRYSYSQVKNMTKGFKDKLGEGGFGSVYRGKLRSGDIVAIKVLGNSKSNGKDFINEVATIGRIHHTNVVRLIGFCVEGSKRALVYEFMPNGSLEKYIFSQEGKTSLSCNQLFDISVGVAHAIEYLHRGCEMQILHFDIKPHNILLDENFNPRVSDFGLAKLYPAGKSMVTLTEARGTMGYIAPEMFYNNIGRVSYKADVYSFGMLLLEMAGRRKNLNVYADQTSQIYFPSWVYDEFKEGREVEMGETTEEEKKMTKKMIITAFWCTQMKPSDRPSMDKVVEMLEGDVELLQMPRKPSLNPQEIQAEVI